MIWVVLWVLSLVQPMQPFDGERWIAPPSQPVYAPPQVHFCRVVSPTLTVCA